MEILQTIHPMKKLIGQLKFDLEKGGETSIGTSCFPLNKLFEQFIKIVTKMRKYFIFTS